MILDMSEVDSNYVDKVNSKEKKKKKYNAAEDLILKSEEEEISKVSLTEEKSLEIVGKRSKKKKKDKKKKANVKIVSDDQPIDKNCSEDVILDDDGGLDSEEETINKSKFNDVTVNAKVTSESPKKQKKKRKRKDSQMDNKKTTKTNVSDDSQSKKIKLGDSQDSEHTEANVANVNSTKTKKKKHLKQDSNNSNSHSNTESFSQNDSQLLETDLDLEKEMSHMKKVPKWMAKEGRKKNNFSGPAMPNDVVELGSKGRSYTVSIAVPASILEETCLLQELRTYVIGQLARTACIYSVDEIVVYDDHCWRSMDNDGNDKTEKFMGMMKMILEYQECPQYLRKTLFPHHRFLSKTGVLNALNATHHLLSSQWCDYREGVVLEQCAGTNSFVNVGLRSDVVINKKLQSGVRVTLKFPPAAHTMRKLYGTLVSPEEPREKCGLYWGYTVRVANSLAEVLKGDRFPTYDLVIGTSDKGEDVANLNKVKPYSHALIVFGGVEGIEAALKSEEGLVGKTPQDIFDHYLNTCPNQQSRTIRTEEAVTITLAVLSNKLTKAGINR